MVSQTRELIARARAIPRPVIIGSASFANGKRYELRQFDNGKVAVVDLGTLDRYTSNTVDGAWRTVRYLAGITHKTERSQDAPVTDPIRRKPA